MDEEPLENFTSEPEPREEEAELEQSTIERQKPKKKQPSEKKLEQLKKAREALKKKRELKKRQANQPPPMVEEDRPEPTIPKPRRRKPKLTSEPAHMPTHTDNEVQEDEVYEDLFSSEDDYSPPPPNRLKSKKRPARRHSEYDEGYYDYDPRSNSTQWAAATYDPREEQNSQQQHDAQEYERQQYLHQQQQQQQEQHNQRSAQAIFKRMGYN